MVCIHSTYYIKIHLLCDIRDSIQAAGGMDSSILWPGKLLKMIVFCKQSPPHSGKKRPFLPPRKRPKSTHLLPYRYSAALYLKQEGTRLFISEPRPKERPIDGGPCKHSDRRSNSDSPAYHSPQAAVLCRAVQRLAYTFMGSKGRFPFFGSAQIIQGFSPPVGLQPKK